MEYRLYFFTNFYVSSIQKGIQAGHCAVELMNGEFRDHKITREWATNHKTFILLNGGAQPELKNILATLKEARELENMDLPFASFSEDEGLNFAMTCVGVIIPDRIFNFTAENRGCNIDLEDPDLHYVYDFRNRRVEHNLSRGDLYVATLLMGRGLAN